MKKQRTNRIAVALALGGIILFFFVCLVERKQQEHPSAPADAPAETPVAFPSFSLGTYAALAFENTTASPADAPLLRIAKRLSKRIRNHGEIPPPLATLTTAIEEQRSLMKKHVIVDLLFPDNATPRPWDVSTQRYPSWIRADISPIDAHFRLSADAIATTLARESMEGVIPPTHVTLTGIGSGETVLRASTSGVARSGVTFDLPTAVPSLVSALTNDTERIALSLEVEAGRIENISNMNLGDLRLLGTGKSDFKWSPANRIFNIHKALSEHLNNVIVPAGATFSFNETLGGPVSERNGWRLAKVIFNTTELRMAPGGGICQTSTTTFRAILAAGFRTIERQNHSMYVSYYEKYGVGIDATVFPGQQDLTFVNDTPGPLLIQAYDEGTEATVNIYGTPDGRTAMIRGPYFSDSDFSDFPEDARKPGSNEIAWIQRVSFADGREEDNIIRSRYTSLPRKTLEQKYTLQASVLGQTSMAR